MTLAVKNWRRELNNLSNDYNAEVFRWTKAGRPKEIDGFLHYERVKWSNHLKDELRRERFGTFRDSNVRTALYRPFCKRYLYHDRMFNDGYGLFDEMLPTSAENTFITVSDQGYRAAFSALATDHIPDLHLSASVDAFQCFPFYTYNEDGSGRRENITEWALGQFRKRYGAVVTKQDIFHYVYALLHHPEYRSRYAENLKRDLPRVPLVPDAEAFQALVAAGSALAALHLGYETAAPYPLERIIAAGATAKSLFHVQKMKLSKEKSAVIVNPHLTLSGIPPEAFQYRLGNRSALEWVLDQYQISTDARSGITSDPNRSDDPEYIVRLIGQVATVSIKTVEIVNGLPSLPPLSES